MKYGTMFAQLMNFRDENFYKEHKIFYFDSIYRTGTYEIVAVILTDTYSSSFKYWNYGMCNKEEFNEYLDFIKSHALYKTDLIDTVEYGDLLCSLSTCAYHNSQGRMLVVGKMIDTDDEKLMR
jgi:sortase B